MASANGGPQRSNVSRGGKGAASVMIWLARACRASGDQAASELARGGSIQGEINALNKIIELAIPPGPLVGTPPVGIALSGMPGGTEVITAHGRIYRQIDVVEYRDMVVIIRDWIKHYMDQNMTLDQIQAAAPAKAWEPRFGATSGPWTTRQFVEAVYRSLMNETR